MKKFLPILIGLFALILYLFFYRANYLYAYEERYSRNLFDNSQWRIPQSKRSIGDELLYQVASYELINHWRYFEINPEVPPLGKYLYGLSLKLTNNAFWANIPVYLLALWFFYLLTRELFKKIWQRNLALFLFVTQPVIFSQLNTTMFDLPQLLSLLIHSYAVSKLINSPKRQLMLALLAGISAGAFVSLKIGYLILFIFLADGYFLIRQKKWQSLFIILAATLLVYPLTYLPYFLQGNSIIDFIKSQLWIMHFYADSKVPIDRTLMPIAFFSGWYRGWSPGSNWSRSEDWSITWPILALVIFLKQLKASRFPKLRLNTISYLVFLFIAIMFAYWLIPFWTRYLVLTIPFLILITVFQFKKKHSIVVGLLIIVSLIQLPFSLISRPQPIASHLANLWQNGSYLDLYSYLDFPQNEENRFAFAKRITKGQNLNKIEYQEVSIRLEEHNILTTRIPVTVTIKYKVPNKIKFIKAKSHFVRKENRWRLNWLTKFDILR